MHIRPCPYDDEPEYYADKDFISTSDTNMQAIDMDIKYDDIYKHIDNEKDFINLIIIENNIPVRIKNLSESESIILNCPSPAWHPENQDTIKFKSWEEYRKWEG